ncbi:MAG: GDYXXLXY domain-containing protein [Lentisphaeria bacterium]|nr:GDYXXLXY domain-containing protein [Lentisphaeria bacterium]
MALKRKTLLLAAVLVVQCLCIGWLILRYECVVSLGTEVRFPCQAFDPYDAFRGRYLQTNVRDGCFIKTMEMKGLSFRELKLFAKVEPLEDGTGLWHVTDVAKEPSADGLWLLPERVYGNDPLPELEDEKVKCYWAEVVFPSKLFVNEKIAPQADEILAKNTDNAVAVYRVWKHRVVLMDVEIDGKPIRELVKAKL